MDARQIEELQVHGIDYRVGVDRFGGNAPLFEKFIIRYLQDDHFVQLTETLESNDAEEAFRAAHTLKGIVGNLSFTAYFEAIDIVAEALRSGNIDEANTHMPLVAKAHQDVIAVLMQVR